MEFRRFIEHENLQEMALTAIVLTFNEEQHLDRCLASLRGVVSKILVVDCFSTDGTLRIAQAHGAQVLQREWVNHAAQFNWALTQLDPNSEWVLRIDADEYLTKELAATLRTGLEKFRPETSGVYLRRRITFQGRPIRHGGVFPVRVLRLFRFGEGRCEDRWMDEHIKVLGTTEELEGELIDDNVNSLTWWTDKHNKYASREVVDLLNLEYGFMPRDSVASLRSGSQAGVKRWIKEEVYAKLPRGFRAFAYFFYRYVIRFGFLDGREGVAFHFLQGFWYRYLVDAKFDEVKRFMRENEVNVEDAIRHILGVNVIQA